MKALLKPYFLLLLIFIQCTSETDWQSQNQKLIEKLRLTAHETDFPETGIEANLNPGQVESLSAHSSIELNPGIEAKIFNGKGLMTALLTLEPNAALTEESLPADRFLFVLEGDIDFNDLGQLKALPREEPDGTHGGTPVLNFVYQSEGDAVSVMAGENGAKLLEVYGFIRPDYLQKTGAESNPQPISQTHNAKTNIRSGEVYDLYSVQLTKVSDDIYSRILTGPQIQLAFTSIDPLTELKPMIDPNEKLVMVTRGKGELMTLGKDKDAGAEQLVYLPPNMVYAAKADSFGLDLIEILWPVNAEVADMAAGSSNDFHAFIPEDTRPELLIDGSETSPELIFTEGPKWMNGKVYFSNMFFDQNFGASPQKSSTIEMTPDGHYHPISKGKMQTNGLYPYKNGNLIVCDMMGHRVVEMSTTGKVIQVLADEYNGKPIDGPNDVITDKKGGFYFTDPQFTMETEKFQPGRAVYYVNPEGEIMRVTEPNEFAMPNGILLSPDDKTLYINNCYDDEDWFPVKSEKDNFLWAYDVNEDGSISNGRKFAELRLPENVLDRKGKSSSADGMAIDTEGNIYVATYLGVQIFDKAGKFVGIINLPTFPVSLCFGGEDMKTLFIVSFDKVYKMPTKKVGYVNYL